MIRYLLSIAALIACATCLICGAIYVTSGTAHPAAALKLLPVEGTVLVNGQPAPNVNVAFHPLEQARDVNGVPYCPVGRTDSAGAFHLTTSAGGRGAPLGEYHVTFVWPDPTVEFDECECPDPLIHDQFRGDQFRGLYANADLGGYPITVSPTSLNFRFNLYRPRVP